MTEQPHVTVTISLVNGAACDVITDREGADSLVQEINAALRDRAPSVSIAWKGGTDVIPTAMIRSVRVR